jgi:hypothetical protein
MGRVRDRHDPPPGGDGRRPAPTGVPLVALVLSGQLRLGPGASGAGTGRRPEGRAALTRHRRGAATPPGALPRPSRTGERRSA